MALQTYLMFFSIRAYPHYMERNHSGSWIIYVSIQCSEIAPPYNIVQSKDKNPGVNIHFLKKFSYIP